MTKKNIAFLISSMEIGGAEKANLALIREFITMGYNPILLLNSEKGELLSEVPTECQVINLNLRRTFELPVKLITCIIKYDINILVSNFWKLNLCACIAKLFFPRMFLLLYEHSPPSKTSTSPLYLYSWLSSILYRRATKIFTVSDYVKADVLAYTVGLTTKISRNLFLG